MNTRIPFPATTPTGVRRLAGLRDGFFTWTLLSAPHRYRARRRAREGAYARAVMWGVLWLASWLLSPAAGVGGALILTLPNRVHFASKDAMIGLRARKGGAWFVDDHASRRPGEGQGAELRDALFTHWESSTAARGVKVMWKSRPAVTAQYVKHHKDWIIVVRHGRFMDTCELTLV